MTTEKHGAFMTIFMVVLCLWQKGMVINMRINILTVILCLAALTVGGVQLLGYELLPWILPAIGGLIALVQSIGWMAAYNKATSGRGIPAFLMVVWFALFVGGVFVTVYMVQNEFDIADLTAVDPAITPIDNGALEVGELVSFVEDKDAFIFEYAQPAGTSSIKIEVYMLMDGQWQSVTGENYSTVDDNKGYVALSFDHLYDGMGVALQTDEATWLGRFATQAPLDITGRALYTDFITEEIDMTEMSEVPVAIQVVSGQSGRYSGSVIEGYNDPQSFLPYGYEYVYAVTVEFSQDEVI